MSGSIGVDARIGGCRARQDELLSHRTQLRRGDEGAAKAATFRCSYGQADNCMVSRGGRSGGVRAGRSALSCSARARGRPMVRHSCSGSDRLVRCCFGRLSRGRGLRPERIATQHADQRRRQLPTWAHLHHPIRPLFRLYDPQTVKAASSPTIEEPVKITAAASGPDAIGWLRQDLTAPVN